MIKQMVLVYIYMQMELDMKDNGKKINKMVKDIEKSILNIKRQEGR